MNLRNLFFVKHMDLRNDRSGLFLLIDICMCFDICKNICCICMCVWYIYVLFLPDSLVYMPWLKTLLLATCVNVVASVPWLWVYTSTVVKNAAKQWIENFDDRLGSIDSSTECLQDKVHIISSLEDCEWVHFRDVYECVFNDKQRILIDELWLSNRLIKESLMFFFSNYPKERVFVEIAEVVSADNFMVMRFKIWDSVQHRTPLR